MQYVLLHFPSFPPFDSSDFQAIHSVTVASHQAEFVHHDPLAHVNISTPQDCHTYPELKRKLYSALAEGDEGELSIAIPKEVSLRQSGHIGHSMVNGVSSEGEHSLRLFFFGVVAQLEVTQTVATPEPQIPGPSQTPAPGPEFMPIVVRIEYSLRNPVDGIQFVLPTDAYPYVSVSNKHIHLIESSSIAACSSCIHRPFLSRCCEMLDPLC